MLKNIDAKLFKEMIIGGAQLLANHREAVDTLNVFPVPDGDTGTNMSLTMQAALRELNEAENQDDLVSLARAVLKGSLKGARGNSGVILSQILKGFCEVVINSKELNTKVFSAALKRGTEIAYNAVTKPKEGTILTVIRMTAEFSEGAAAKNQDFLVFMQLLINRAEEVLKETPEMLPVLKKAGVVDSGGKGLIYVIRGFYNVMAGIEIPVLNEEEQRSENEKVDAPYADIHDLDDIKYAYCTEFFVTNIFPKTTESDIDKFRDELCEIGDSTIVIGDIYLVKVHVHTNNPDQALGYALRLGEIDKIKIENMLQQNRALKEKLMSEKKPIGIISVSGGAGLEAIFKDYGVDRVIEGGQTMNPSVKDFSGAINTVNADSVIILPNNKNIVLAAEHSKELAEKRVIVVPTTNISEGLAALMAFSPERTIEENQLAMTQAMKKVKAGQVTYAVKNTSIDGFKLKVGDIIGITSKGITAKDKSILSVVKKTIEKLIDEKSEVVTLFYGNGMTDEAAAADLIALQEAFPNLEICTANGGQPHYYYYISVE
ncbi:MAG: DAK2 domain-containing protein [Clostridiales bacterium]|jgi:DAK2 domain fusion protein YloV|nr:DAK2 domain-containing protein [Clostridiales bacterium]